MIGKMEIRRELLPILWNTLMDSGIKQLTKNKIVMITTHRIVADAEVMKQLLEDATATYKKHSIELFGIAQYTDEEREELFIVERNIIDITRNRH